MILTPFVLMATGGVRVSVLGEGNLRFSTGHALSFSNAVTLRPNDAGLLADTVGRPVLPEIRVSGPFTISMNGTVKVSGKSVGRVVLQTKSGDIGFPGEGTMGVLQIEAPQGRGTRAEGGKPAQAPVRQSSIVNPRSAITTISIHPKTEVAGDRILLRDVADLSGDRDAVDRLKEIDLGETPVLGSRRTLMRWSLQNVLRNAGIADSAVQINLPPDATIARKSQTVDPQTFIDTAKEEAKQAFGKAELEVTGMGPSPLVAPMGELTFKTTSTRSGEKMTVTIRVRIDDRPIGERMVQFSAKLDRVQSGEAVRIRVIRNGAVLETDGKAKSAGYVGDTIQVATLDGSTMSATVTGVGQVEVNL